MVMRPWKSKLGQFLSTCSTNFEAAAGSAPFFAEILREKTVNINTFRQNPTIMFPLLGQRSFELKRLESVICSLNSKDFTKCYFMPQHHKQFELLNTFSRMCSTPNA